MAKAMIDALTNSATTAGSFLKCLYLDKNNNLGITVVIELALMLRAIQRSFMVYKWTMAMEYCIDPKNQKSETEYKAIAIEVAVWPKL